MLKKLPILDLPEENEFKVSMAVYSTGFGSFPSGNYPVNNHLTLSKCLHARIYCGHEEHSKNSSVTF